MSVCVCARVCIHSSMKYSVKINTIDFITTETFCYERGLECQNIFRVYVEEEVGQDQSS